MGYMTNFTADDMPSKSKKKVEDVDVAAKKTKVKDVDDAAKSSKPEKAEDAGPKPKAAPKAKKADVVEMIGEEQAEAKEKADAEAEE